MRPYVITALLFWAVSAAAQQDGPNALHTGQQPLPGEAAEADGLVAKPLPEESWSECDEYISPCKVTINLGSQPIAMDKYASFMPHAHWDVQVKPFERLRNTQPLGNAAVLLVQSSPFLSCRGSAVPANPARDLSTNIGSLLTSIAGMGAPPLIAQAITEESSANEEVQKSLKRLKDLSDQAERLQATFEADYKTLVDAQKKDWKYSFRDDADANDAIGELRSKAQIFLGLFDQLPGIETSLAALSRDIAVYEATHPDSADGRTLQELLNHVRV